MVHVHETVWYGTFVAVLYGSEQHYTLQQVGPISVMVFSEVNEAKDLERYALLFYQTAEGVQTSVVGIWKFIQCYQKYGTAARQPGSGPPSKVTPEIEAVVEEAMDRDDETTATQLQALLAMQGHSLSLQTIQHSHSRVG